MLRASLNIYFPKPILMPAKFTFAKIIALCSFLIIIPILLNGQCAPLLSVLSERLILDYETEGNTPSNLDNIDVDLGDDSRNGNYDVAKVFSTWQTSGTQDFTGLSLTGTVTIHYTDLSTDVCEYINGIYNDPLPVELSIFNGHLMENDVFLSWSTESETDNAGFQIERSFNGQNFERIAFENGGGNSEEKLWYSFQDIDVKNEALGGIAYYRLKQINYDQTFSYSDVVAIDLKLNIHGFEITKVMGWDNPDRMIKVFYNNPTGSRKINISVATINGQLIQQKSLYPLPGFNSFEIDLSNQKENMFFVSLNNGKEMKVEKLILHSKD